MANDTSIADTIAAKLWRASLLALVGAAISMALGGILAHTLPPGITPLAVSLLVPTLGIAITSLVVWLRTRDCAGDIRRPELVAVLAFVAVQRLDWLDLPALEGLQAHALQVHDFQVHVGRFAITLFAFGFAMLVLKWLMPIDEREAGSNQKISSA